MGALRGGHLPRRRLQRHDPGAARTRRPARQGALEREFEVVVVPSPDRLARNYVHQMVLIEEFEKGGCRVEFVERPMSSEPNDQLLLQIRGAVAE